VLGYCPGTGVAASGEGSRDAMVGVLGLLTGAGIFVAAYPWLDPIIKGLGDYGKVTIPDLLGVSPWVVIVTLAAVAALVLWLVERHERHGVRGPSPDEPGRVTTTSWKPTGRTRPGPVG
jgi:hypothetical protein